MTNKELYAVVKSGDFGRLKGILPDHYLSRGEPFVLPEGKTKYGAKFEAIDGVAELDKWYANNYKLSGKYSDDLTIILLPDAPNVRIEIKDRRIFKALWMFNTGLWVDITHNVYFLNGVPLGRMPDSGYIHGTIISRLPHNELYQLIISPFPDERILRCEFVVAYAHFVPLIFDKISDMFGTLKNIGFNVAATLNTTSPKWSRAIENTKIMAGSGNLGYKCTKIITAYSDIKMIDLLSGTTNNMWGVTTNIPPTALLEVAGIRWGTIIDDNRVNIIPIISFKYGSYVLDEVRDGQIEIDPANKVFHKKILNFKIQDINNYCLGDLFDGTVDGGMLVLKRRFGSKDFPIVAPSCPKCGQGVDISDNKIFCVNTKCTAVVLNNIKTWVGKFCPGVDEHMLTDFVHNHEITNIGDIYTVADGWGKGTDRLASSEYPLISIGVSKSRAESDEFLNILIPFLDMKECREIINLFHGDVMARVNHIFTTKTLTAMGFDDRMIGKLLNYIEGNKISFVNTLRKFLNQASDHPLHKRTFFIDGLLYERDRTKYERFINKYAGRVISHVTPYIDGFVYGEYINSNIFNTVKQLATHKDVAIYTEEEFQKLVEEDSK